jgi:Flp pilus assembly pilin Flp
MIKAIVQLLKEEEGQSMVEYGIILALISVVAIGVVQAVGQRMYKGDGSGAFEKVNTEMQRIN